MGSCDPPYPDRVRFDDPLAAEAIEPLRSAIRVFRDRTGQRVQLGAKALENWRGGHADAWRPDFVAMFTRFIETSCRNQVDMF
jgi:hypothetical protein